MAPRTLPLRSKQAKGNAKILIGFWIIRAPLFDPVGASQFGDSVACPELLFS